LLAEKPDIVHCHLYYGIVFYWLCGVRVPFLYTHHNIRLGKGRHLFAMFNRVVDTYIGICDACVQALLPYIDKPIRRIYNGIPMSRFQTGYRCEPAADPVRLVQVGRLSHQKNHLFMIEVLAALERDADCAGRWRCEFVGEGPEETAVRAAIRKHGLEGRVVLTGNQQDVAARLHAADLFVMTSRYEGFPIALLEAVAAGLPAVVTNVGGCREVVGDSPDVLVEEGNVSAFTAALRKMILDPSHRARVGARNEAAAMRFDIRESARDHLEVYRDVVMTRERVA
jgi:glycosyltransferase involved in cell wall biosynthesis